MVTARLNLQEKIVEKKLIYLKMTTYRAMKKFILLYSRRPSSALLK